MDLGVNFFLKDSDVSAGTPRGIAIAPRLQVKSDQYYYHHYLFPPMKVALKIQEETQIYFDFDNQPLVCDK
jgi:hypothetical protein